MKLDCNNCHGLLSFLILLLYCSVWKESQVQYRRPELILERIDMMDNLDLLKLILIRAQVVSINWINNDNKNMIQ